MIHIFSQSLFFISGYACPRLEVWIGPCIYIYYNLYKAHQNISYFTFALQSLTCYDYKYKDK